VATPLTFVTSLDSPFADLFDQQVLFDDAERIRKHAIDNNHWDPMWEWGQYEDDWAMALIEWGGKITVEYLRLLDAFGMTVP
jgi:hypothetical protein